MNRRELLKASMLIPLGFIPYIDGVAVIDSPESTGTIWHEVRILRDYLEGRRYDVYYRAMGILNLQYEEALSDKFWIAWDKHFTDVGYKSSIDFFSYMEDTYGSVNYDEIIIACIYDISKVEFRFNISVHIA